MPLPAARPRALPGSASAANARGFMPARRALLAGRASRAMSRARRCSWTRRGAPSRAASCHMQEISSQERPLPSLLTLYNRGLPRGRCRRAERLFSAHRAQLAVAPNCEARAHGDLSWPISCHPAVGLHPFDGRGPSAATATRAPPPPAASWALHAGGRLHTRSKVFGDRHRWPGARSLGPGVLSGGGPPPRNPLNALRRFHIRLRFILRPGHQFAESARAFRLMEGRVPGSVRCTPRRTAAEAAADAASERCSVDAGLVGHRRRMLEPCSACSEERATSMATGQQRPAGTLQTSARAAVGTQDCICGGGAGGGWPALRRHSSSPWRLHHAACDCDLQKNRAAHTDPAQGGARPTLCAAALRRLSGPAPS